MIECQLCDKPIQPGEPWDHSSFGNMHLACMPVVELGFASDALTRQAYMAGYQDAMHVLKLAQRKPTRSWTRPEPTPLFGEERVA